MIENILEIRDAYPSTIPEDPYLDIIASVDPKDLNVAIIRGINSHKKAVLFEVETRKRLTEAWQPIIDYGNQIKEIHSAYAMELQQIASEGMTLGVDPSADLMDDILLACEIAETPSEVLGLTSFTDFFLKIESQMHEDALELVAKAEPVYGVANAVKCRRDKLGLPAKVATWFAGVAMTASLGIGIAKSDFSTNNQHEINPDAEVLVLKGCLIWSVTLAGVQGTAYTANGSGHSFAKRRAKSKL